MILKSAFEPGCTRTDLLEQMGLNAIEIGHVLKHDEYLTQALKNVSGLEAVV